MKQSTFLCLLIAVANSLSAHGMIEERLGRNAFLQKESSLVLNDDTACGELDNLDDCLENLACGWDVIADECLSVASLLTDGLLLQMEGDDKRSGRSRAGFLEDQSNRGRPGSCDIKTGDKYVIVAAHSYCWAPYFLEVDETQ